MKNTFRVTAVAFMATALAACGVSGSASETSAGVDAEAKTVALGSFIPETGSVPDYKLIASGSAAYFSWLNDNGGINGWTFEYTQVDDGYDPARSLAATRRLVENRDIFALVAPIGTPTNSAVKEFAVEQKLPVIGAVSGDPELPGLDNYFILLPNYFDEARLDVMYAVEELDASKIAILYQNDDLGKPALDGAQEAAEDLGVEIVAEEAFNVSDTDLTAQITKARDAEADLTLVWGSNGNVATAVTTAERLGYDGQIFAPFYTADPTTYELAGDALEGTMFGSWLLPTTDEAVSDYVDQMEASGKSGEIGVFSLNGWTNAALFGAAFEKITDGGKAPTREALLEALTSFTEVPVGGTPSVTFAPGDHSGTRALSIVLAKDGEFTAVTDPIPFR